MAHKFKPILTTTDWGAEWIRLQEAREHFDDPTIWDKRAETFHTKHGSHSDYANRFLELASAKPGESVLDMGCGTGALALPLAQSGCKVIAADFSKRMLEKLENQAAISGISGITTKHMSWDDDWDILQLGENSVDIAIASRSIATNDLEGALNKLSKVARRRVCITLPRSSSPRADQSLLAACGVTDIVGFDFVYAFNILVAKGIAPTVSYIETERRETFESESEAVDLMTEIARSATRGYLDDSEFESKREAVRASVLDRLSRDDDSGLYFLEPPRKSIWAFLAWDIL